MTKRKTKKKIVVLDLDDTVLDFLGLLCLVYNKINGTSISPIDFKEYNLEACYLKDANGNEVNGTEVFEVFKKYEKYGLYAAQKPLPESRHALSLIRKLGYKIFFMTARNAEYEEQTKLNLMINHIDYDELIFAKSDEKAKVIRRLSKDYNVYAFVDDKASTVIDVEENTNTNMVFARTIPHNADVELDEKIMRINSIFDIIRHLKDISDSK